MCRNFIDNNILLDFLVESREFNDEAMQLFQSFSESDIVCYSYGSISDLCYVARKQYGINENVFIDFFQTISKMDNFECLSLSNKGVFSSFYYAKQLEEKANSIKSNNAGKGLK